MIRCMPNPPTLEKIRRWSLLGVGAWVWLALAPGVAVGDDALVADRFNHLGLEHGLGERVLAFAQDHQGFLWLGLQSGLARYDGREIKSFFHDPQDPSSLSNNYIRDLLVDRNGDLWVANNGGTLDRRSLIDETFESYSLPGQGFASHLIELKSRDFAVLTGAQLLRFEPEGKTFQPLADFEVSAIAVGPSGRLWSVADEGLWYFDSPQADAATLLPWPKDLEPILSQRTFVELAAADDGVLWMSVFGVGVVRLEISGDSAEGSAIGSEAVLRAEVLKHEPSDSGSLIGNDVISLYLDSRGILWVGAVSGLNRLDPGAQSFQRYSANLVNARSLPTPSVFSIIEDRTGQIWLGTDSGAARFDPFREAFCFYAHDPLRTDTVPPGSLIAFAEDADGRLWIGSRGEGIARVDRSRGESVYFKHEPDDVDSLADDTAWALLFDSQGRLWVGGEAGISRLDPRTGQWARYHSDAEDPSSLSASRVVTLYEDATGTVWVGTDTGLASYDPQSDSFSNKDLNLSNRVLAMVSDSAGRLYAGLDGQGLVIWDTVSDRLEAHHAPGPGGLSHGVVSALTVGSAGGEADGEEVLWVATLGGGLNRLDSADRWTVFNKQHGLPKDSIRAMVEDDQGYLWLAMGSETTRFKPDSGSVQIFGHQDGFPSIIHTKASFKNSSGEIFFGGIDGFTAVHPDRIRVDRVPPRVALTDFAIGPKSISPRAKQEDSPLAKSVLVAEKVVLDHRQNDFSINMGVLHFGNPSRNRLFYKLEGIDQEWIETDVEHGFARYAGIPAGSYRFRARAQNRDGIESEHEAQLEIRVKPPPWDTLWAWTAYVLIFSGGLIAGVRRRLATLKEERDRQATELRVLRGLLPICASCKKIRDEHDRWESLETYLDTHSEAKLSHGICPECAAEVMKGL